MADIFVSYRNTPERREIARRFVMFARAVGFSVWWDDALQGGDIWKESIDRELAESRIVIVLWCLESVNSDEVLREARAASGKLLPIKIQDVRPPPEFAAIHAESLFDWEGTANAEFLRVLATINEKLGTNASPAPLGELRAQSLEPLPAVDDETQQIVELLQEQFMEMTNDGIARARRAIQLHTPISEMLEDFSSREEFAKLALDFCVCSGACSPKNDEDTENWIAELEDLHDSCAPNLTVGRLVRWIVGPSEEEQAKQKALIESAVEELIDDRRKS